MGTQVVRLLWLSVVRQARPVGGSMDTYATIAKRHYDVETEVVDLGQYSAEHSNSCMFLTCAISMAHRRLEGFEDAVIPGILGQAIEDSGCFKQTTFELLIEEHKRSRISALGRLADALRHAACEVLLADEDFYIPFYNPVRRRDPGAGNDRGPNAEDFRRWVKNLRSSEEGDALVLLALTRLCGMAVQPVHKVGYRVPLMDPLDVGESGHFHYWGNDDRHWVWLRVVKKRA